MAEKFGYSDILKALYQQNIQPKFEALGKDPLGPFGSYNPIPDYETLSNPAALAMLFGIAVPPSAVDAPAGGYDSKATMAGPVTGSPFQRSGGSPSPEQSAQQQKAPTPEVKANIGGRIVDYAGGARPKLSMEDVAPFRQVNPTNMMRSGGEEALVPGNLAPGSQPTQMMKSTVANDSKRRADLVRDTRDAALAGQLAANKLTPEESARLEAVSRSGTQTQIVRGARESALSMAAGAIGTKDDAITKGADAAEAQLRTAAKARGTDNLLTPELIAEARKRGAAEAEAGWRKDTLGVASEALTSQPSYQ